MSLQCHRLDSPSPGTAVGGGESRVLQFLLRQNEKDESVHSMWPRIRGPGGFFVT